MTYKVTISVGRDVIIFEASPVLTESRSANYDGHSIVHLPTDIWAYKNTSSRHFSITAKLVSRNLNEAKANSRYVDLIRSWLQPDFGGRGATPPIVKLNAFKNKQLKNVPCIIKSYSTSYPDDVDWISSTDEEGDSGTAMPVILTIGVELDEAWSAAQITEKKWKIKPYSNKDGKFVYGASQTDVTAAGGGQHSAQQPQTTTPSVLALVESQNQGLASVSQVGTSPWNLTSTLGNGNLSDTVGINVSSQITDKTTTNSPMSGYNLETARQLSVQSQVPPSVVVAPTYDSFNKKTNSHPIREITKVN